MLLMVEALLLFSAALLQDHRADGEEQIFPLDMALNSVDDQYDGCREKMAHLVETQYLKKEKSYSDFKNAWKYGEKSFKSPKNNVTKSHSIAIYVYTNSNFDIYKNFNTADRNEKKKYKNKSYRWYSLHFLLTDAIQILKKTQNKCFLTYRGTKLAFNVKNVLNKEVRLGSFTSSSLNRNVAKNFGRESCFEIYTCKGADVTAFSKLDHEKEVLIPPYETFKVTAVRTRKDQKDLWCNSVFSLKSSGVRSDLNCALFQKHPTPK